MVTVTELNRAPDGRFETLEAATSITDPAGVVHTGQLADGPVDVFDPQGHVDKLSDRAAETDYQNTNGAAIIVSVTANSQSGNVAVNINVGDSTTTKKQIERYLIDNGTTESDATVSAVVPDGYYYSVGPDFGFDSLTEWHEQVTKS